MKRAAPPLKGNTLPCRVLTCCTIDGRPCIAGDTVELTEPQRGFLIDHRIIRLLGVPEMVIERAKRGKDGPAV